jgi:ATP-dependent Zn protease
MSTTTKSRIQETTEFVLSESMTEEQIALHSDGEKTPEVILSLLDADKDGPRLYDKTQEFIQEHWREVEVLAEALLEKETIPGNEVVGILQAAQD